VNNITLDTRRENIKDISRANDWAMNGYYMVWLPFNMLSTDRMDPFKELPINEITSSLNDQLLTRTWIINKWRDRAGCFIPYFPTKGIVMTWDNEKIEIFPLRHPIKKVGLAK
jgi:hypothetical protein